MGARVTQGKLPPCARCLPVHAQVTDVHHELRVASGPAGERRDYGEHRQAPAAVTRPIAWDRGPGGHDVPADGSGAGVSGMTTRAGMRISLAHIYALPSILTHSSLKLISDYRAYFPLFQ